MIRVIELGGKTLRETRMLLLRHAETSAPDRFHGAESDVGLGEAGRLQAEAIAEVLGRLRLDALYCSGMRRARETAEPIAKACGLVPQTVDTLHERRMGPLSGRLRDEAWDAYAEAKLRWMSGELGHTHEGGESYAAIQHRCLPEFQSIANRHPGQTVAVVAHGVVIRVLLCSLLDGCGPSNFGTIGIDHVAVNDLRWDGSAWSAVELNARWADAFQQPADVRPV
jgi:2,3-bisphosphoglycerate-dependent phosphoglycerate mutase